MENIKRIIIDSDQFDILIKRLVYQIMEKHDRFQNTSLIGIQPRGVLLAKRIYSEVKKMEVSEKIDFGVLDTTFYRDDYRRNNKLLKANKTEIKFSVENKNVILIDDVLYTGRTVRAAMDALLSFGRPNSVELLVLINRRFQRHLPISHDYVGKSVNTFDSEYVKVHWRDIDGKDQVMLDKKNKI